MIREKLVEEYIYLVNKYYPHIGYLLSYCYLTVIDGWSKKQERSYHYLGIYYAAQTGRSILLYQNELKELAENLGLFEVIFLNATRIVRDPLSNLKTQNPRLWLELYWIATKIDSQID
ncbi:conserved hypothetical protein [Rippkaea orientalis PCC 8801]|uniref:Uncharacterized protein n=1 Tax=Rippkaea orientalis (strain PCC 8801 / RF-1) TaxID=41431 RepID=B7JWZ5_RIPO1|nr:hypothetical protein [Rippkaea orientalis]ACK65844.1 conserved hypothetical protein [Rippkaea orientalis PCC 8801]